MSTSHNLLHVARRMAGRAGARVARVALAGVLASSVVALAPGVATAAGSCPNEALRAESNVDPQTGVPYSMQLPDCRAYEQVTPPFKGTNVVEPKAEDELGTAITRGISSGGSPLLEQSVALLGGAAGGDAQLNPTAYELARGASGWTTSSLTPLVSVFPYAQEQLPSAADVAVGLWAAATPSQSINAEDYYRREADGAFVDIGPVAPPAATAGPPHGAQSITSGPNGFNRIVGASADLSDVVFQLDSPPPKEKKYLWPDDATVEASLPSLYEYAGSGHTGEDGDVPALVGVDNENKQIGVCGTGLGADVETEVVHAGHEGVSAGGSTIFFNVEASKCAKGAPGPKAAQVYARIGIPGAQTTVNVAGTSECASSAACNVTKPVTYEGSSEDGSRVFFTTTQALLPSDTDTTKDIYECELPGDGGATPAPSGVVNACPDPKAVSVTGTGEAAKVQSVVAISEDGSRVYFTAAGVLTSEPDLSLSSGHQVAKLGGHNLYVWEAPTEGDPTGHTAFIATLKGSEASPEYAQATPDGRYLVFTTAAPKLTPGDTSTVAQAFRYDAQTGELIRVSVGQNGFNNNGNTSEYPVELASTQLGHIDLGRLTVSEDGSYIVFQSEDALTPQVQGSGHNVYEWHEGNVYLISDGTDTEPRARVMGIDASGADIYFTTADRLVGQDTDESRDVYDARIDGGFPAPTPAASCSGEACQGPPSGGPAAPLLGSIAPPAIGNLAASPTGGVLGSTTQASGSAGKVQITKQSVKGSTVTLSVKVPAGGVVSVSGSGLRRIRRSVSKSATYTLKLTVTKAGSASLRKHKRLKVKIEVLFTPSTGARSSAAKTVTFKA